LIVLLLLLSAPFAEASPPAIPSISEVIVEHVERYPELEIQDLYKLLHQAALGNRHASGHGSDSHDWIADDLSSAPVDLALPLFERLSPDGRLVRVNLRPLIASGGDRDRLDTAFRRTAHTFEGSTERLESYLAIAGEMSRKGKLRFLPEEVSAFFAEMKERDYPPVHHSERYRTLYLPAYRVVLRQYLPGD
jgi:hypothetical protein